MHARMHTHTHVHVCAVYTSKAGSSFFKRDLLFSRLVPGRAIVGHTVERCGAMMVIPVEYVRVFGDWFKWARLAPHPSSG